MSGAREAMLDRIERALRTARIPSLPGTRNALVESGFSRTSPTSGPPEGGPHVGQDDRDPKALLDRFLLEARALGVEAFVEGSVASVRERLAAIVGTRRVLSWNPERLPYDAGAIVAGACLGSAPLREQADAEIGVTGCDAAIAETGSLVLLSAPGAARTVSLLPPVHVALVRPQDLCFSMGGFFEASAARMADASSCTVVTGPSRTADIELSLTIGVHGPGRVVVIIGPRDERAAAEDTKETEDTKDRTQSTPSSQSKPPQRLGDTEARQRCSAGRPAVQADEHGRDRTEIRTAGNCLRLVSRFDLGRAAASRRPPNSFARNCSVWCFAPAGRSSQSEGRSVAFKWFSLCLRASVVFSSSCPS